MSWSPSSPFTFSTGDTVPVQSVATFFLIDQRTWLIIVIIIIMVIIIKRIFAKDYLRNSLVKSRIALASPGCSFGWLVVCHHAKNNQMYTEKMVVDCPPSDHIQGESFFQTRAHQEKEEQLVHSSTMALNLTFGYNSPFLKIWLFNCHFVKHLDSFLLRFGNVISASL